MNKTTFLMIPLMVMCTVTASFAQSGYKVLKGHTDLVCGVAFSPDDKYAASAGSWDNTIKVWDCNSGVETKSIETGESATISCVYSKNGDMVMGSGTDGTINFYQVQTQKKIKMARISDGSEAWQIDISPDGKTIAVACWNKFAYLLDINTMVLTPLAGHSGGVHSVAFSPDGKTIATGSDDKTIILWDVKKKKKKKQLIGHNNTPSALCFSADSKKLYSGGDDKCVKIWDAKKGTMIKNIPMKDMVRALDCSPNGRYYAAAGTSGDPNIYIFDSKTDGKVATLTYHTSFINDIEFSNNSQMMLSGSSDNDVVLWDLSYYIK